MATHHHRAPQRAVPTALIAQAVPMLTRHELASLTERLIDALDTFETDPDLEPDDEDSAIDDGPCDEFNQDLEEEESIGEFSDPQARRDARDRIRRTRCAPRFQARRSYLTGAIEYERDGFDLWEEPHVPTKRQLFRRKRGVPRRPRG